MALTDPSNRLEAIPPYMFAELERKVAEKKAAGIDVINLGIGDPDTPTYPHIVEAMQAAVADSSTHQYPSNRGRAEFREAFARVYDRRFGVAIESQDRGDPRDRGEGMHLQPLLRLPRSGGSSPWPRTQGYPVYTGSQILAGAEPVILSTFGPSLGSRRTSTRWMLWLGLVERAASCS